MYGTRNHLIIGVEANWPLWKAPTTHERVVGMTYAMEFARAVAFSDVFWASRGHDKMEVWIDPRWGKERR